MSKMCSLHSCNRSWLIELVWATFSGIVMSLCPWDPDLLFKEGLKKHSWAYMIFLPYSFKGDCSTFPSVSSIDDAAHMVFGQMVPYKAARQMGKIFILIRCPVLSPVKSVSKFSTNSMGAGSDADNSCLWWDVLLPCCPACKQMCFHAWCKRGELEMLSYSHCRMVATIFFPSYDCLSGEGN